MPRDDEVAPSARILGSFEGRAEDFGFTEPPIPLRLKLVRSTSGWTLFLQPSAEVPVSKLVAWLPPQGLLRIEFGSRRVVRGDYRPLPRSWAQTFAGVELDVARLEPGGTASVTVTGTRRAIAAFARRLFGPEAPLELVKLHAVDPPATFLTLPQDDALRAAVTAGYYKIPRSLNLNELAEKLGISSASLSERLRRAEGHIITRYVDAGSASPWDEQTIFDAGEPDAVSADWPESASTLPPARRSSDR